MDVLEYSKKITEVINYKARLCNALREIQKIKVELPALIAEVKAESLYSELATIDKDRITSINGLTDNINMEYSAYPKELTDRIAALTRVSE